MAHLVEVRVPKDLRVKGKKKGKVTRFDTIWESLEIKRDEAIIFSLDKTDTFYNNVITFKVPTGELTHILNFLDKWDAGTSDLGEYNVTRLEACVPVISSKTEAALPLHLIVGSISSGASISFDYIAFLVVASIIAGIGLATDNSVTVVASMLVSPLMGPILAFTFGTIISDWKLVLKGLGSEAVGILVVWISGAVLGLIFAPFGNELEWPAGQMADRGTPVGLLVGAGIAFPSGIGVAMSVTGGVISSLVGVAISAALLPPIVNSGMNFIYAFVGPWWNTGVDRETYLIISLYSFLLLLVNILFIYIGGIITFKVKQFAPVKDNIDWAQVLERSEVHTTHGNVGHKTLDFDNVDVLA